MRRGGSLGRKLFGGLFQQGSLNETVIFLGIKFVDANMFLVILRHFPCSALFGVGKIMTRCPVQFDVAVPDGSVSRDVIVDAM